MAIRDVPSFGDLLRRYRHDAGMTQDELAAAVGLSWRDLNALERGEGLGLALSADLVTRLADALNLSPGNRAALEAAARQPNPPAPSGPAGPATPGVPSLMADDPSATCAERPGLAPTAELPSAQAAAIRTFLFADVRDYTRYSIEHGDEAAAQLTSRFIAVADEAIRAHGGRIFSTGGDAVGAVFVSARQALRAAVAIQASCAREREADPAFAANVGVGLDAGEAVAVADDYRGTSLNLASRLCGAASPGEVLSSETVISLARRVPGLSFRPRGLLKVNGFDEPVPAVQVAPEGAVPDTRPGVQPPPPPATATEPPREPPIGSYLGALPDGPLVAREAELAQLLATLDAVAAGEGRLILLSGEPGVGKTRLAQEVTLLARNRGFLVAAGCCYEPQGAVAYYPFLEALTHAYAAAPATIRADLPRRWAGVSRLLPDQDVGVAAASAGPASGGGRDDQQRLFWQVTGFLQALAGRRPVALLLDDLHWADSASLDLLQHLARHTPQHRILLVGTYRDVEVNRHHPLEHALRDLGREKLVKRINVRRLSQAESRTLIALTLGEQDVSEEFAQFLYGCTEGNPFFTQEIVRALVDRGDVYQKNGQWDRKAIEVIELPEIIRSVIGQRLSHQTTETQQVLRAASVLGQMFSFQDLAAMSGRTEDALEAALDAAIEAGLAHEVERDRFRFHHALFQQALYRELPARKKRRLHRAAGEALEKLPERKRAGRVAELAYHFLAADEGARALPYALQAGDQAEALYAHSEAEQHYRTAIELAREIGDQAREAEALEKLATVLVLMTHYDEALELSERALELYHAAGDVEGECRAVWQLCWSYYSLSRPGQVIARLEFLLGDLRARGLSVAGQARLHQVLARLLQARGRVTEEGGAAVADQLHALAVVEQAIDLAQEAKDDEILARALQVRGESLIALGRPEDAMRAWEAVVAPAEAAGLLSLAGHALASTQYVYQCRGEFDPGQRCIERAVALVERSGNPSAIAHVVGNRGEQAYYSGDWAQARADFERAIATMRAVEISLTYSFPPLLLGLLCLVEGQEERAAAYLAEPLALAEREHDLQALRYAHGTLAERDLLNGNPQAACARLEPLLDRPGLQEPQVLFVLPQHAWSYLELGVQAQDESLIARADALAAESRARAIAAQHRLFLVDALRVQAMARIQQARWQEAVDALEESIALCRDMRYPYAEAKALYVYGQLHAAKGEPERAREKYLAALAICERLGEGLYRPHIERALTELDLTP